MEPKLKAQELLKSMYGNIFDGGQYEDSEDSWYRSKQCALIAVDEILSDYKNYLMHENTEYKGLMYWQEVKQEIENL